uniref:Uncharacterized protein n=1 Tax=Arundo donax TaxID=35708 RepID=A0A0A9EKI7_ARUDO
MLFLETRLLSVFIEIRMTFEAMFPKEQNTMLQSRVQQILCMCQ